MDEDLVGLTTPVSKRSSVVKMLKKQISKEAREAKTGRRQSAQSGYNDDPSGWAAQEFGVVHTGAKYVRRRSIDGLEAIEISFGESGSSYGSGESSQVYDNRLYERNVADRYASPHHTPRDFEWSGESSQNVDPNSSANNTASTAHSSWSSHDRTDRPSCSSHNSTDHQSTSVNQTRSSEAISETSIPDVQRSNNSWQLNQDSYYVYGPSFQPRRQPLKPKRKTCSEWWEDMWSPYGGFHRLTSGWMYTSLILLFIANGMFLGAFLTNNWGVLHVLPRDPEAVTTTQPEATTSPALARSEDSKLLRWIRETWRGFSQELSDDFGYADGLDTKMGQTTERETTTPEYDVNKHNKENRHNQHVVNQMERSNAEPDEFWSFGLWQCCRNTDGLCLGTRWAGFYTATRIFAVLGLFSMILSFAWMMGHTLEKLLDYDVCTMSCLIALSYASSVFCFLSVLSFGVRWPVVFKHEFDGTEPHLSFSYFLAAFTIPLTLGAAICSTIDLKKGVDKARKDNEFYTESELSTIELATDLPRDNISRPKYHKKKRRGSPYGRYTSAES